MEGDRAVGNDKELTSTNTRSSSGNGNSSMEEILSSTKQKGESGTNDTLPTSSTDASTSVKSLHLVSDDPISSTSSEMDSAKTNVNNSTNNVVDKTCSTFDTEAELLEMSIGIQTCEKIEENVDDLVNDLETLLGESTDSFTTTVKPAGVIKEKIEEKKKCDADVQDKVREKTTEIAVGVIDLQEPGPSKDSRAPDCVDTNNSDSIVEKTDPHEQNDQKITGTFASEDQQKTIEETKPVPEINIRRKTVEQDLEKVVCLSEESSDSDANGAVSIPHKQSETNEDTDLIKIAEAADEMPDPEVTEGDAIEEFLSLPPEVESAAEPADSGSNLETILAVASLENESVSDNVRVERRLSEKEIQEMEAIRMAVASITDSSQDTYDSFLVENSVAIDSCVQEASENVQQCPMTTEKQFPNATLLISSSADSPADDLSKEDSDNIADTGISGKSKFADDNAEAGDVRNSRFDDDSKGISEVIEDNDGDNIVLESAEVSKEVLSSEEGFQETVSQVAENKGDDIKMDNQTLDPPAPESICVRETGTMSKEETEDTAKGYCAANTLSTVEIMHCNPSEVGSLKLQPKEEVKCATQESSSFITEENKISLEMELNLCQTTIELNSDDADTAGEVTSLKMASEAAGGTKEHDEDIVEKEIFKTETTEQFVEAKDEVTCNESTTSETDETMKKTETTVLEESNTLPCKKVDEESKLNIPKNVINTDHIDMPASDLTVEEKQVNNATIELFDKPTDTAPPSCGEATDIVEETKVERTEDMEVLDKETPEEVANEGGSLLQNAVPEKEESDKGEVPEAIIVEGDEMSPLATDDPTSPEQLGTTELQEVCPVLSKETVENVTDKTDENVEGNAIVSETVSGVVMESVVRNDDDDGHTTGSDEIKLVHKETENVDHQEGVLLENEGQFTKNKEKSPDKNEPMKQDTAIGDCLPVNQTVEEEIVLETSHVKEDEKVTSPKEVCQEDDLPKHEIIIAEENPKMAAEEVVIPEHDGSASEEIIKEDEEMSTPKGTAEDNNSDSKKHIEGNVKLETVTIDSDRIEIRSESNVDKPIESSTSVSVAAEDENTESESKPLLKLQENDSDEVQISEQKDALNSPEKTGVDEEMDINTQNVADQKPATDLPNEGLDKQLNKGNAELGVPKNSATAELVAGVSNISEEAVKGDDLTILKPLEDSSENKDEIKALVADSNSGLTSECMAQAGDDNNQKTVENSKEISEEIAMQHSIEVSELLSKNDSSDVEQLVKENSVEIEGNQELITEESQAENNLSVTKCIAAIEDGENNELPTPDEDAADERRDENNLSALKGVEDRETIAEENILSVSKAIDDVGAPETLELPVSEQKIAEEKENSLAASEGIDDVEAEERIELPVSEEHIAEERSLRSRTRRGNKVSEPLSINVEGMEKKDKVYSPKITIKPVKVPDEEVSTTSDVEGNKGSLKMTITKQSDKMRSILKVFSPEDDVESTQSQDEPIPKLIIKPKMQQVEQQHSPKMTTRSSKTYSPTNTRCSSPRVSIKPVPKPPEANSEILSPLKITFKPVVKPEEVNKRSPKALKEQDQKNVNPKITIKPIPKPSEVDKEETAITTPKVIIKPIKRHLEEDDAENVPERSSPKITIKPVIKIDEQDSDQLSNTSTPKLKIKPIKKQDDPETGLEKDEGSPKISIKPLVKPPEHLEEDDEEVKERIVLKINKGNLPTPTKDPKKREYPEDDKSEKVGIKLKFSTTGGHTHIVQDGEDNNKRQRKDSGYSSGAAKKDVEETPHKRASDEKLPDKNKRLRSALTPDTIEDNISQKVNAPIIINENLRFQHSSDFATAPDPLPDIAKIADLASQTTHIEATSILTVGIATPSASPAKKRGRPRKAHLEVREEFKDPTSSQAALVGHPQGTPVAGAPSNPASDSGTPVATPSPSEGRPKRSCRGQNVIATLGIKPRKPRGGGRGRGSKVNMGDRESPVVQPPTESVQAVAVTPEKEEDGGGSKTNVKLMPKSDKDASQKHKDETTKRNEEDGKSLGEQVKHLETDVKKELEIVEEDLKRKKDDGEEPSPPKKKKDDKTSPRKLEVTTRRQRAQQQKGPEAAELGDQKKSEVERSPEAIPSCSTQEIVVISTDDDSSGKESPTKSDSIEIPPKSNVEPLSEIIFEKRRAEKFEGQQLDNIEETNLESEKIGESDTKGEKKVEAASAEEDSDDDSEVERRREWILLKKQEAIKKCRAKRMEKLARAAELKKKRQEQAAQQREARKAAEEAERAAAEKLRATKRYGRYGLPKPQISLIDEPVRETDGTVKSHMGLFDPALNIAQPTLGDYDNEKAGHLKQLSSNSGLTDSSYETPLKLGRSMGAEDVVMLDEETRMSADFRGSRAQTPAKHAAILPPDAMVEDSQGSLGTEGGKSRSSKAPKMEVFQDSESTVFTADQLAEYSWNGQGPYMLQEQVAQYLGIKSFKRKYPQITRRPVDMQERDYLKENGLATEAQCDLGLTAVVAQDILDIMYTDFQEKYEEYCRCQREKQARELANKQKFLNQITLKPGFDKLDILEQVVQSAAAWNQHLNKARKEQRRAYMDLQNLTVQYPKSRMKVVPAPKIGHYPVALVPGQFTDYFKEYTPTELNNLPLNTMCYDEIKVPGTETESEESSSGSESDSESCSSSDSNSSCDDEDCKDCKLKIKGESGAVRETDSDEVVFIENDASSSDSVVLVSVTAAPVTA